VLKSMMLSEMHSTLKGVQLVGFLPFYFHEPQDDQRK